jgi:hypothetical protein
MDAIQVTRKIARARMLEKIAGPLISPVAMNVLKRPETLGGIAAGGLYGGMKGNENATEDQKTIGTIGGAIAGAAGGGILGATGGSLARSFYGKPGQDNLITRYRKASKALDKDVESSGAKGGFFKKWYKPYESDRGAYLNKQIINAKGDKVGRLDDLKDRMGKITDNRNLTHKQQLKEVDKLIKSEGNLGRYVAAKDELKGNAFKAGAGALMGFGALNAAKDFGAAPDAESVASSLVRRSEKGNQLSGREKMLLQDKMNEIRAKKMEGGNSSY